MTIPSRSDGAQKTIMVLATVLLLVALFSITCLVVSAEDSQRSGDPRDTNPILWTYGRW